MTMLAFDSLVAGLERAGVPRDRAIKRAAREFPEAAIEKEHEALKRADVLEKEEQREVRKIFLAFGFDVYWLSQARKTGQTAGVPDLWLMHRELPIALYWETKRQVGGRLSEPQIRFRDACLRCNIGHGVGDRHAARSFLIARGLATVIGGVLEPVRR